MSTAGTAATLGALLLMACAPAPEPAPATGGAPSASGPDAALAADIARADSLMFAAYNAHDAATLGGYFAKELEFFHDTGGLLDWTQAMAGLTSNFAKDNGIRRDLVGPIEVFPIRDYGAVELGRHRFCHREPEADECGTFRFVMVWRRGAHGWQVTRAVSFDH